MQSSVPKKNLPEINFQDPCVELHIRIPEKMDPDRIEKFSAKYFPSPQTFRRSIG